MVIRKHRCFSDCFLLLGSFYSPPVYKAHQNFCGVFGFGLKWRLVEKQTKTFLHNQDLNSPHTQLQFRLPWIMSTLFSFPETRNLCAERDKATDSADSSQGGTRGITERSRVMFIRTTPKNRKRKLVRRQNDLTRPTLAEFPRTASDVDQLMRNRRQPRLEGPAPGVGEDCGAL